jgi:hypothetical protein
MAHKIFRQAGYHDLVLCAEHSDSLIERPEHNGSWTAGESVGEDQGCDACIRKGLDYAHISAKSRQRGSVKKAA